MHKPTRAIRLRCCAAATANNSFHAYKTIVSNNNNNDNAFPRRPIITLRCVVCGTVFIDADLMMINNEK